MKGTLRQKPAKTHPWRNYCVVSKDKGTSVADMYLGDHFKDKISNKTHHLPGKSK